MYGMIMAFMLLAAGSPTVPISVETIDQTWPEPPGEESWTFVEDLKKPLPFVLFWKEGSQLQPGQVDLRGGLVVKRSFPDKQKVLETAYADLEDFLAVRQTEERRWASRGDRAGGYSGS